VTGEIRGAREDLVFNAAVTLLDLEESLHSPASSPRVSAEPVGGSVLSTETEDLDGVTTSNTSGDVVIDTRAVGEEVFVDGEGTFNGTVLVDLRLDLINTLRLSDGAGNTLELLGEVFTVSALGGTSGGEARASSVREASIGGDTVVLEEFPGHIHIATVATVVVGIARDELLRREDNVDLSVGGNGESVREGL